jgi:tRNA threonylcarbamoyladenosine biosynthesis protein TsaB
MSRETRSRTESPLRHIIAALETTESTGSVALYGPGLAVERTMSAVKHGPAVYAVLQELLDETGISLRDVAIFAAGAGPGSFTGVRVALAAVKALAYATGAAATAESDLDVLAFGAPEDAWWCPVIDARKAEVYAAVYAPGPIDDPGRRLIAGPWVMSADDVVTRAAALGPVRYVGSGVDAYRSAFPSDAVASPVRALSLARLVATRGESVRPANALYVRPAEAEVKFGLAPAHDPLASLI